MGLGYPHEQARRALLADLRDGDPCARCGQPMYRAQADQLDADHVSTPRALDPTALPDALSHARCNRRHGSRLKAALRGIQPRRRTVTAPRAEPVVTSRDW